MTTRQHPGLHPLARGAYAWLAPQGSWGWSNAGLIVDGEEALLIDTLYDLQLTAEMLRRMRAAEPAANAIGTLVNTHALPLHRVKSAQSHLSTRQTDQTLARPAIRPTMAATVSK